MEMRRSFRDLETLLKMPSDKKLSSESKLYEELVERFCASLKKSLDKEEEDVSLNTSDYLSSEYESEDEIKVRKRLAQGADL